MKKYYCVVLILACCTFCRAQYVTIPDTNFVTWLNANGFASCIAGNQLDTTCPAVLDINRIDCNGKNIYDLAGVQYFKNLDTLLCYDNSLSGIAELPAALTYLDCSGNKITVLPALPLGLRYFICGGNQLTSLPELPLTLKYLSCSYNQLLSLPGLTAPMYNLDCSWNLIDSLPELPPNLGNLDCSYNLLTNVPILPELLTAFYCDGNLLTALPALPDSIHWLSFSSLPIVTLPSELPVRLLYLSCDHDNLSKLPPLPASLISLDCNNNQLDSLPALPLDIQYIYCYTNRLTSLPVLPQSLNILNCSDNQLTELPSLPDSMNQLDISSNPYLYCLPQINTITSFSFTYTNIECVPDYGQVASSTPVINTVPLCTNAYNPGNCADISTGEANVAPNTFNLFPNPAHDEVEIILSTSDMPNEISMTDITGREVLREVLTKSHLTLDVSMLIAGMYLIQTSMNGEVKTAKLVKQ